jgi:hypothetical protein
LTGQLSAKGVTWNSYQEDVQYSTSPLVSASGTGGTHNGNTVTPNTYNLFDPLISTLSVSGNKGIRRVGGTL